MTEQDGKIRVAIFGGSGYGGSELLRILLFHPNAEIALVTANEHAGKKVPSVHRNLLGLTDLAFSSTPDDLSALTDIDVAFLALPHGQGMSLVPKFPAQVKVIDLSGDHRISDPQLFERYYKTPHPGQIQARFVYGLTETNRDAIKTASHIANPGCFATAILLGIAPLAANGIAMGRVIVDAKTGSSGSGAKPAANTHHPQRMNSFYAYKPFEHQHVPEIEQHLAHVTGAPCEITMITHSLPVSRGIFATCYFELAVDNTPEELRTLYQEYYRDSFFMRFPDGSPDINWVKNTNFCDIGIFADNRRAVVFSAIDNLVKGAAGQAVQNMNLMFGLPETTGLVFAGGNP